MTDVDYDIGSNLFNFENVDVELVEDFENRKDMYSVWNGNDLAGVAQVKKGKKAYLCLFINVPYRCNGIGDMALNLCEQILRDAGADTITTTYRIDHNASKSFAEKHGYKRSFSLTYMAERILRKNKDGGTIEMNIIIKELQQELFMDTAKMITELMNYHRKLNNAPKEFWQKDEESIETLKEWQEEGTVYNVFKDEQAVGFFYVRFGGQNVAWLEDLYISEQFRGQGIGKKAMATLDELMREKKVTSMFVDVIPRNTSAIKLYRECGFDHLNMIQLRKNYDERLNKQEDIDLLGFEFKKY